MLPQRRRVILLKYFKFFAYSGDSGCSRNNIKNNEKLTATLCKICQEDPRMHNQDSNKTAMHLLTVFIRLAHTHLSAPTATK